MYVIYIYILHYINITISCTQAHAPHHVSVCFRSFYAHHSPFTIIHPAEGCSPSLLRGQHLQSQFRWKNRWETVESWNLDECCGNPGNIVKKEMMAEDACWFFQFRFHGSTKCTYICLYTYVHHTTIHELTYMPCKLRRSQRSSNTLRGSAHSLLRLPQLP